MSVALAADSGQVFWSLSRAAGVAALLLSSAAVSAGVAQGAGWIEGSPARDLRPLHEALSLGTLVAIAVHALALIGDDFIGFSLADVLVPFSSTYMPWWTSLGILAGWALSALGLTYYARSRIGVSRWRSLHRFTALVWIASIAHSLGEGTDAGKSWFLVAAAALALPALALLLARWTARLDTPRPSGSAHGT